MTIPRNLSFLAQGASSTGVLSVPYGGTGLTTLTAGYIPYGNGTGALNSSSNLYFSGSNLGINVTPVYPLHVANPASTYLDTFAVFNELGTWNANGGLVLANYYASTTLIAGIKFNSLTTTSGDISFHTGGKNERMRIGASGGVSIGNTTDPGATNLLVYGAYVGAAVGNTLRWDGAQYYPYNTDGVLLLGYPSNRWNTVYATTGTINTSDGTQKKIIGSLSDKEQAVAKTIKGLFKTYQFNSAIEEKGADKARIHVGVIAQDVEAAFIAQGLDPTRYALFCSDTWYEVDGKTSDDLINNPFTKDTENAVAVTRLGVRYEELLAFVLAAT